MKLGLGWRRELAHFTSRCEAIDFVEVLAEHLDPARPLPGALLALRERGCRFVLHGVGLSLGGAEPLRPERLERLARLAEKLEAVHVSEHLCFVRAGGLDSGHLLPLPRTDAALEVLCENVRHAQRVLGMPLTLENIAGLFEWPAPQLDEARFIARALDETGASLLLDAANLHANARNHGWEVGPFLDALPLERLAYVHVAGGVQKGKLFHDTHAHPVSAGALEVLAAVCARVAAPPVLLERDDAFPSNEELLSELAAIARVREGAAAVTGGPGGDDAVSVAGAGTSAAVRASLDGARALPTSSRAIAEASARDVPAARAPEARGRSGGDGPVPPPDGEARVSRTELGASQEQLLRALLDAAPVPDGFDPERVIACAASLGRKRTRAFARQYPALARELGEALEALPGSGETPLTAQVHALARSWAGEGALTDRGYLEWLALSLRRRAFGVTVGVRTGPMRVCVGLRAPAGGERWLSWGRWDRGATRLG